MSQIQIVTGLRGGVVLGVVQKKGYRVWQTQSVCWKEASWVGCRSNLSRNVFAAGDDGRQVQWARE